jgi:glycerophosphoryl diester phosphodiesterase
MKPILIGHRGAMALAPENTLASFKRALEFSYVEMVELDVYVLTSGELVVIHDDKVDRTTNGKGYIIESSFDYLRSLDAGKGELIPTLYEVLDLIDKRIQVNIELKGENTAQPVADIIKQYIEKGWQKEQFLVSSFNHIELKTFKELMPDIHIGVLLVGIPVDYALVAEKLNAYSIHPCSEFINQAFIDDAHTRGIKVYCWTLTDPDEVRRVAKLGVDGIFVNNPELAHKALE